MKTTANNKEPATTLQDTKSRSGSYSFDSSKFYIWNEDDDDQRYLDRATFFLQLSCCVRSCCTDRKASVDDDDDSTYSFIHTFVMEAYRNYIQLTLVSSPSVCGCVFEPRPMILGMS
jgi:hypothetical protein